MLQTWNSHARYTYNCAVWRLNTDMVHPSKLKLRNDLVAAANNEGKEWVLDTPKEIRARAVFEAFTRWKTGLQQITNRTIQFFHLKYRTKHDQDAHGWTIDIQKQSICKDSDSDSTVFIYKRKTQGEAFRLTEPLQEEIQHDCKIHFDGTHYYLLVPVDKPTQVRTKDEGIIALDPGVRTFLSGVDSKRSVEIGNGSGTVMFCKLKRLDSLISKQSKEKNKRKRKQLYKKIKSLRTSIKNMQEELHKKTSTWLCKSYSNIVIPQFGSKDMVKRADRKLKTKTVRAMNVLGHGRFLQRLEQKAKEWNTTVIKVDEKYTSKTCSACGSVKTKRFTSKQFTCENKECLWTMDRDRNGAINILKKLFLPQGEDRADRA